MNAFYLCQGKIFGAVDHFMSGLGVTVHDVLKRDWTQFILQSVLGSQLKRYIAFWSASAHFIARFS
jgi:hypothetical protein